MGIVEMLLICVLIAVQYAVLSGGVELRYCSPRPKLIAIDSPYFNYFPYYAELHRCDGMCSTVSPRIQKCTAASTEMVSKSFFDLSQGSGLKVLQLVNHTSCNCSCAQNPGSCHDLLETWNPKSCSCECRYTEEKPYPCPKNFKWNQYACNCFCDIPPKDCPVYQKWNKNYCGCLCTMDAFQRCAKQNKQMDKDTCACYSPSPDSGARAGNTEGGNDVNRNVVIGCMIAELILLLFIFDLFLYCHYGDGLMTFVRQRCCQKKRQDPASSQKDTNERTYWSKEEMI